MLLLKIFLAGLLSLAWEPPEDEHPVGLFLGAPPVLTEGTAPDRRL